MNQRYKLVRGVIQLPSDRRIVVQGDYIRQGQEVPEGLFSAEAIADLLKEGKIELFSPDEQNQAPGKIENRGRWGVDPVSLAGKSFEDLLVMVQEIDPEFQIMQLVDEAAAIRQLTEDWNPAFSEDLAQSSDRSAPGVTSKGVRNLGGVPFSPESEAALARARELAQAPRD